MPSSQLPGKRNFWTPAGGKDYRKYETLGAGWVSPGQEKAASWWVWGCSPCRGVREGRLEREVFKLCFLVTFRPIPGPFPEKTRGIFFSFWHWH